MKRRIRGRNDCLEMGKRDYVQVGIFGRGGRGCSGAWGNGAGWGLIREERLN